MNSFIDVELTAPPKPFSEAPYSLLRAEDIMEIIYSLAPFLPLTVRSIYYKVISSEKYLADHWRSQKGINKGWNLSQPEEQISEILKYLRLVDGRLPLSAINDDSRIVTIKAGETDFEGHITNQLKELEIDQFSQCLAEEQELYIEVWVEKNGLVHIAETAANEYCRRVIGCKGFPSVTCLAEYAQRVKANCQRGQEPMIIYFGDCDPTGWLIPKTIKSCLYHEHHTDVEVLRYGLNPDDITDDMVSIALEGKKPIKDSFIEETGLTVGYELDLLDPADFQDRVRQALAENTDEEVREIAMEMEEENNKEIAKINDRINKALKPIRSEYGL